MRGPGRHEVRAGARRGGLYYWSRLGAPKGDPASLDVRVSDGPTGAHVVAFTVIG